MGRLVASHHVRYSAGRIHGAQGAQQCSVAHGYRAVSAIGTHISVSDKRYPARGLQVLQSNTLCLFHFRQRRRRFGGAEKIFQITRAVMLYHSLTPVKEWYSDSTGSLFLFIRRGDREDSMLIECERLVSQGSYPHFGFSA